MHRQNSQKLNRNILDSRGDPKKIEPLMSNSRFPSKASVAHSHLAILSFPLIIILMLCIFMSSCDKSTDPKTGSLSGYVTLVNDTYDPSLDPIDFSGVTVAIYELAVLDTTIVRINREYPGIGVQISQETEFDHRLQNPISAVTTNAAGDYSISKIPSGTYNVVAFKEGWGVRIIHNVKVFSSEQRRISPLDKQTNLEVELYPETLVSDVNHEYFVFRSLHNYVIKNSSLFLGNVEIQKGAVIRIDEGKDIKFYGSVNVSGNSNDRFLITSNDAFCSASKVGSIQDFDKIVFVSEYNIVIDNGIIRYMQNGVQQMGGGLTIDNMVFTNGGTSIVGNMPNTTIANSIFREYSEICQALYSNTSIENNIYYANNSRAIMVYNNNSTVTNNYILENNIGIQAYLGDNLLINNCFDRNKYAVSVCASSPTIGANEFYSNGTDIELNHAWIGAGQGYLYSSPMINKNNFLGDGMYISLFGRNAIGTAHTSAYGANEDLNCPLNYYKNKDLRLHLFDVNNPNAATSYQIYVLPRLLHPNPNAGIL